MTTELLMGDEAVALAAIHAGIGGAFSYPGTPATEIFEFIERHARRNNDIAARWSTNEKVALAVRVIEHPEIRHLGGGGACEAACRSVQTAPSQLRLALGSEIHERRVALENLHDSQKLCNRLAERPRCHERRVVSRRVMFGVLAVRRSHEAADG